MQLDFSFMGAECFEIFPEYVVLHFFNGLYGCPAYPGLCWIDYLQFYHQTMSIQFEKIKIIFYTPYYSGPLFIVGVTFQK